MGKAKHTLLLVPPTTLLWKIHLPQDSAPRSHSSALISELSLRVCRGCRTEGTEGAAHSWAPGVLDSRPRDASDLLGDLESNASCASVAHLFRKGARHEGLCRLYGSQLQLWGQRGRWKGRMRSEFPAL